ncbi:MULTISPECIES: hypothetical protein [Streptomyces]|uniref:Uncharacterized protein n=1 Tax=Streptomyces dengpaensis TaxID=2049881 RepID=A0ABM6SNH4_9ACTN|nr:MULTISPECIES: hypothetical protein [Streptomyces]AVH55616.1 hypothetical protein C4B68_07270 [Streptomyces dengpaensis]PIB11878.1 hypothetical protein B1C81_01230 [Streptomyces sp. HG99]
MPPGSGGHDGSTRARAALLPEREDDPYLPAIIDRMGIHAPMAAAYRSNSDAGAGQDLAHFGTLRGAGMLLRALDADPALKTARDERSGRGCCR